MKKMTIRVLPIILLAIFSITGCSKQATNETASSQSAKEIVIKGQNFVGNYKGNNTAKDPNYKYSMYFDKNGHFVQDIISSKGFAGRFTEKGTYEIAKNGDVTMNITSVTEERFASDSALSAKQAPISIVQRKGTTLTAAEDHPIKIENKKTYLLGTVNKVKLYPTDKKTVNYNKHYQSEVEKYDSSYGAFSGHGFTSNGQDTPMNAITFKNNDFLWHYGYQDANGGDDSAIMAVFEGTYSYDSHTHIMTLNISNQSRSYYGDLMSLSGFEYQKSSGTLVGNNILKLRYQDDSLSLISKDFDSWDMKDNSPADSTQSYPKYDDYLKQYGVSNFESQMHKTDNSKASPDVKKVFTTKDDFAQWVTDFYRDKGDYATDDDPGFHVLGAYEGGTVPLRDNISDNHPVDTKVVYALSYSTTSLNGDSDAPDVNRIICITSDGQIYSGHFTMPDDELTQAYRSMASND